MRISDWSSDVCSSDLMPAKAAVRVHIGDDMETRLATEAAGDRIGDIGQPLQRAFHPPFGHGLPRMLAGIEPDLQRAVADRQQVDVRSEEHTSELQSLMRISYAVFCLKKKKTKQNTNVLV